MIVAQLGSAVVRCAASVKTQQAATLYESQGIFCKRQTKSRCAKLGKMGMSYVCTSSLSYCEVTNIKSVAVTVLQQC